MKGENKIEVNEDTAVAALQEYFDARGRGGLAGFEVKSVEPGKSDKGPYGGGRNTFVVKIQEIEGEAPPPEKK